MGGPSDILRKTMKRPTVSNWRMIAMLNKVDPLPTDKCKCGVVKFKYQKYCYDCVQRKEVRQTVSKQG